ncbi:hypothetical protein P9112_009860 [Eukaryota sp. TZLM1-RC]
MILDHQQICQLNGLERPIHATKLEFFMLSSLSTLPDFSLFPQLVRLHVLNSPLSSLDNLHTAPHLTELFIIESRLTSLTLPPLPLQRLILYSNSISSLSLPPLPSLNTLDLANNSLSSVAELFAKVPNLKWLNLANNHLSDLNEFINFEFLEFLNVSGNQFNFISNFYILSSLKNLRHLVLNDPKFGQKSQNLVCKSLNYKPSVIMNLNLSTFQILDQEEVSEAQKTEYLSLKLRKSAFYATKVQKFKNLGHSIIRDCRKFVLNRLKQLDLEFSIKFRTYINNQILDGEEITNDLNSKIAELQLIQSRCSSEISLLKLIEEEINQSIDDVVCDTWFELESWGNLKLEEISIDTGFEFGQLFKNLNFEILSFQKVSVAPFDTLSSNKSNFEKFVSFIIIGYCELPSLVTNISYFEPKFLNIDQLLREIKNLRVARIGIIQSSILIGNRLTGIVSICQKELILNSQLSAYSQPFFRCVPIISDCFNSIKFSASKNNESQFFERSLANDLFSNFGQNLTLSSLTVNRNIKKVFLNFLTVKDFQILNNFPNAEYVDFSFNIIKELTVSTKFPDLKYLYLKSNNVSNFHSNFNDFLPNLHELDLSGNPILQSNFGLFSVISSVIPSVEIFCGVSVSKSETVQNLSRNLSSKIFPFERPSSVRCRRNSIGQSYLTVISQSITSNDSLARIIELDLSYQSLNDTKLKTKSQSIFLGLKSLKVLLLDHNSLTNVDFLKFLECPQNLTHLSLVANQITSTRSNLTLPNLTFIDLAQNPLNILEGIEQFPSLKYLNISFTNISNIDPLVSCQNICDLAASFCKFSSQGSIKILKKLPKLQLVDLSNSFQSIDDVNSSKSQENSAELRASLIFSLKRLKALNCEILKESDKISANSLFSGRLTVEMLKKQAQNSGNLETITSLDLSGLGLKYIYAMTINTTKEVPILSQLKFLNLELNSLKNLDDLHLSSFRLPNVECLFLANNKFSSQSSLLGLTSLKNSLVELDLSECQIQLISHLPIAELSKLTKLTLSGNLINSIDANSFANSNLLKLDLSRNRISSISPCAFNNCSLQHLNLNDNSIRTLTSLLIPSLITLGLASNRISDSYELCRLSSYCRYLTHLNLVNTPVSRRNKYRELVVSSFSMLVELDMMPITLEERSAVDQSQNLSESTSTVKVPVKISTFNFEAVEFGSAQQFQFHQ